MSAGHSTTKPVTLELIAERLDNLKDDFDSHIADSKDERKECEARLRRIEIAIVVLICTTMTLCIVLKFGMPLVGLAPIVEATFEKALACIGQFIGLA